MEIATLDRNCSIIFFTTSDEHQLEGYRNVIVNMDYIDIPLDCDFILKFGEKLPISRRKKSNVIENYMMYFIKKQGEY